MLTIVGHYWSRVECLYSAIGTILFLRGGELTVLFPIKRWLLSAYCLRFTFLLCCIVAFDVSENLNWSSTEGLHTLFALGTEANRLLTGLGVMHYCRIVALAMQNCSISRLYHLIQTVTLRADCSALHVIYCVYCIMRARFLSVFSGRHPQL